MRPVSTSSRSRAARAHDLRPLNAPAPIRITIDADGQPATLCRRGWLEPPTVVTIQDQWRIDDEWWREHAISRLYYALLLDDGSLQTVYHDLLADAWFQQHD